MGKIAIVFPKNNAFVTTYPKPVIIAAFTYIKYSKFAKDLTMISPFSDDINHAYQVRVATKSCRNKSQYKKEVLAFLKELQPKLIEVHQDVKLASFLAKYFPSSKIVVVKHGDKFFSATKEKFRILRNYFYHRYLKHIDYFFCISKYVKDNLGAVYPKLLNKMLVIYNSYGMIEDKINQYSQIKKKQQIIFVGKAVTHKGFKEFMLAISNILFKFPDYKALVVVGIFSHKKKYRKLLDNFLEKEEIKDLITKNQLEILEKLSNQEVFTKMLESEIAVIPTKTNEPFGLVALEYHLAGCAVISSGKGGLREISDQYALYLSKISPEEIIAKIQTYIKQKDICKKMAEEGRDYVIHKFDPNNLCLQLDQVREAFLSNDKN